MNSYEAAADGLGAGDIVGGESGLLSAGRAAGEVAEKLRFVVRPIMYAFR